MRDGETGFAVPFGQLPKRIEKDIRIHADGLLTRLEDNTSPVANGGDTPEQKVAKAALRSRFLALGINPAFVTNLRRDRDALDEIHEHNRTEVQEGTIDTALIDTQLTLTTPFVNWAGEDGSATALSLFLMVACLALAAFAIDLQRVETLDIQLQNVADTAAHAALIARSTKTEAQAKAAAVSIAQSNLPAVKAGAVIQADWVEFGNWNAVSRTFTPTAGSTEAVRVTLKRTAANGNPIDIIGDASPQRYLDTLQALLRVAAAAGVASLTSSATTRVLQ